MIKLTNGYFLDIDDMNVTLKQKKVRKDEEGNKKEYEVTHGYFSTIEGAVRRCIKLNQIDLLPEEAMQMEEYIKSINRINENAVSDVKRSIYEVYGNRKD